MAIEEHTTLQGLREEKRNVIDESDQCEQNEKKKKRFFRCQSIDNVCEERGKASFSYQRYSKVDFFFSVRLSSRDRAHAYIYIEGQQM